MKFSKLLLKWKELNNYFNDKGVPFWMVRDPQTLEGSVSLTLVVMSSFLVTVGIVGKWSGWLGGIDMASAFNFFYASTALYFGHSWVNKDARLTKVTDSTKDTESTKVDDPDKS